MLALLGLSFFLSADLPPIPPGTTFRWVDAKGVLSISDSLGDVPEPYYSLYVARLKTLAEKGGATPSVASRADTGGSSMLDRSSGSSGSPLADAEAKRRASWKELVAYWRKELSETTDALVSLDGELEVLQANPILRELPANKEQIAQAQAKRAKLLAAVEKAKQTLVKDLPERARKEHVPPAWLQ